MFEKKLDEKVEQIQEFAERDDYDEEDLQRALAKTKLFVGILEEINLKEKLTFKRALSLCAMLLK